MNGPIESVLETLTGEDARCVRAVHGNTTATVASAADMPARRFPRGFDEHRWMQLEDDPRLTPAERLRWLEEAKEASLRWLGLAARETGHPDGPPRRQSTG